MPVPAFDHNHVLPPHLGNPTVPSDLSPYVCNINEFCQAFATTEVRRNILIQFVNFRIRMTLFNIISGFQWIDGSFTEDIEKSEKRDPNDIDVVTFFRNLTTPDFNNIQANFIEFIDPDLSKANYGVDHYPADFGYSANSTVELTRYWVQLFTHNRNGIWKGIIQIPLNTMNDDQIALGYLNSLTI